VKAVVNGVKDALQIVALLLAIFLMAVAAIVVNAVIQTVDDWNSKHPVPAVTQLDNCYNGFRQGSDGSAERC
jgi:hypothetical protein